MTDLDQSQRPARWLPSPGCLFAVLVPLILSSIGGWFAWRVHRQGERLAHFEQLEAELETTPVGPEWLKDVVAEQLGGEYEGGFTDITVVNLFGRQITDADLMYLNGITDLQELYLGNTQITDTGLEFLSELTSLKVLYLNSTQLLDAGVEQLRSEVPGVEIVR